MMGALIRALTNNAVENIEEALGMTDATSSAMKHAIAEWYAAWYGRAPTKTEDPCQRLPYAIVNKLCKATFGEYDTPTVLRENTLTVYATPLMPVKPVL